MMVSFLIMSFGGHWLISADVSTLNYVLIESVALLSSGIILLSMPKFRLHAFAIGGVGAFFGLISTLNSSFNAEFAVLLIFESLIFWVMLQNLYIYLPNFRVDWVSKVPVIFSFHEGAIHDELKTFLSTNNSFKSLNVLAVCMLIIFFALYFIQLLGGAIVISFLGANVFDLLSALLILPIVGLLIVLLLNAHKNIFLRALLIVLYGMMFIDGFITTLHYIDVVNLFLMSLGLLGALIGMGITRDDFSTISKTSS